MNQSLSIPGYTYGTSALSRSPISLEDFDLLKKTVLFDDDDTKYLRMSADVLTEQTDAILEAAFRSGFHS